MKEYCSFCDNCPVRDKLKGDVAGTYVSGELELNILGGLMKTPLTYGLLLPYDQDGHITLPIKIPKGLTRSEGQTLVRQKLASCDGPVTEERGWFRKRAVPVECGAFSNGVIDRSVVAQDFALQVFKALQVETMRPKQTELTKSDYRELSE